MANAIAKQKRCIVQTHGTLISVDADWTTRPELIPVECEEQCGQVTGSMTLELHAGYGWLPGAQSSGDAAVQAMTTYTGYVRLLITDPAGAITLSGTGYSGTYTAIWYGVFGPQETLPDGKTTDPGGTVTYTCHGLVSILDTIYVNRGYEWDYASSTVVDPGYCPAFNANQANGLFGDKHTSTATINGHSGIPIHDRSANGTQWTAYDVIRLLLAGYAQQNLVDFGGGVRGAQWALSIAQAGSLDWQVDKLEFRGKTVLECINSIINPRRGLTWYHKVGTLTASGGGTTITIYVESTAATAITSGTGGTNLPAATNTCALDARGSQFLEPPRIIQDITNQFDEIRVEGNHPLMALSLNWNHAHGEASPTTPLVAGWDTTLEIAWGEYPENPDPKYTFVFRRFYINPAWGGGQYGYASTLGLRNLREIDSTGSEPGQPFGVGGYNGARNYFNGSGTIIPGANGQVVIEKFIPVSAGGGGTAADPLHSFFSPLIFVTNGAVMINITDDYTVSIEDNPAAIVLSGNIEELANAYLLQGWELVFTLGIRESMPLLASYLAPVANWARDLPRTMIKRLPHLEQWVVQNKTVLGVTPSPAGSAWVTDGGTTVCDDMPKLFSHLAFLRAWFGQPSVSVSWMDHSKIDYDFSAGAFRPGALLTTVQRGDAAVTANAVICGRKWILQEGPGFGTAYTTQRVIPDIDSIEAHPMIYRVVRSAAERTAEGDG